jgi:hypothetical protein
MSRTREIVDVQNREGMDIDLIVAEGSVGINVLDIV